MAIPEDRGFKRGDFVLAVSRQQDLLKIFGREMA
jgi:hypothetical protein